MEIKINNINDISNKNPFTVPENYFARFNNEIMSRLPEKEITAPKTVSMWDRAKPWVYMAAMFMGLFFSIQVLTKNGANRQREAANQAASIQSQHLIDEYWSTVKISEEEFYQYLEDQVVKDGYYDLMYNQTNLN